MNNNNIKPLFWHRYLVQKNDDQTIFISKLRTKADSYNLQQHYSNGNTILMEF